MKLPYWLMGCALAALASHAGAQAPEDPQVQVAAQEAAAQEEEAAQEVEDAEAPQSVEERLDEIDQKLRVLDRRSELDKEQAAEKAKTSTSVTSGKDGFSLKSADGAYVLKLRGYVQLDGRFYSEDEERPATDTFILRRVRPILEGTVFKVFDFRVMPDFGGGTTVLQDAYVDARFTPAFKVRAGKFKAPVGLERLQSGTDLLFVERAFPTSLVPNRDLGIQVHGDLAGGGVNYAVGVFNGVPDGASADVDSDSGKDIAARVFLLPFAKNGSAAIKGLGFGVAASRGNPEGTLAAPGLAGFRTPGQQTFFSYRSDGTAAGTAIADGSRERLSPQLYWYAGPFGLLAEYATSKQEVTRGTVTEELGNDAWQVAASWALGGNVPSFRGVSPKQPFDLEAGTWGAFELAARWSVFEVDDDAFPLFADPARSASRAEEVAAGVNWYFNRNVRVYLDYSQTRFEGGGATGDREDEKVLLSRFQISF